MVDPQLRDLDLVAVTSHEMRTPLAAISGFVDTLRRGHGAMDDRQIEEFLAVIATQAERLTRLVDDLLLLAGLEAGAVEVAHETVMLVPFLETVVRDQPEAAGRIRLIVSADAPAAIETDPLRLGQVVGNLLANALKYSRPDSEVTLTAEVEDGGVSIEVADRGAGIPADELSRVFDLYYRTAEGRAAADGAGLGLAITRDLTEALGGHVTATSVPGTGSAFRVSLPQRPARAPRS